MSALWFRIIIDPLSFIHSFILSIIQISDPFLCSFSAPGTVPCPREPAISNTGQVPGHSGLWMGQIPKQLVAVQANEADELITFIVSVPVFIEEGVQVVGS